jgi:hypothetical protein
MNSTYQTFFLHHQFNVDFERIGFEKEKDKDLNLKNKPKKISILIWIKRMNRKFPFVESNNNVILSTAIVVCQSISSLLA